MAHDPSVFYCVQDILTVSGLTSHQSIKTGL